MAEVAPRTLELLRAAGWHEGRATSTDAWERALAADGYIVHEAARSFLRELGGLELQPTGPESRIRLDPLHAIDAYGSEWALGDYAKRVGAPLCAVGTAANGYLLLVLDPAGRMFGGIDETLVRLGGSPLEGLDALAMGRETPSV